MVYCSMVGYRRPLSKKKKLLDEIVSRNPKCLNRISKDVKILPNPDNTQCLQKSIAEQQQHQQQQDKKNNNMYKLNCL